ncbi:MAG: hypothetical protein IJ287_03020 [Methanobrevibacter sp.]|nr:hypothetical protein [Methanobrevibacter sp.]
MSFLTVEDINGTSFDNQGFWWYELDTALIDHDGNTEFTDVVFDFCKISKKKRDSKWRYIVEVDNSFWTKGIAFVDKNDKTIDVVYSYTDKGFNVSVSEKSSPIKILVYMGIQQVTSNTLIYYLKDNVLNLNLKQLNSTQGIKAYHRYMSQWVTVFMKLSRGFNEIKYLGGSAGFVLVKLSKTDFQFACNQDLTVGEVNTVQLGTLTDYKPNGDLVGEYATKLSVLYDGKALPVVWNESVNDYTFNLDLTNETEEKKIRFKVLVEANDVLNSSENDVVLESKYETINTLTKLTELFRIGGTGRLSSNLRLTSDLTVSKSVNLIGNDCSINMTSHKLVIPSDKTFKAQSIGFSNGVNTLQQEPNSTVELNDCNFINCTGFGSVIDCQVDLASLDESDDFNTKLNNCTISNCDMAILHGGNLEVTGCNVIGKISNKNYPYFLYQTDGNATILNSEFSLTDETAYDYDLEFNTCIFTCGETAQINGYSHSELQQNNRSAFFDTQRNTSKIDVQYYYSLIEDTVHLQSDKGFCHSVSGVDFAYKTNITLTRGD